MPITNSSKKGNSVIEMRKSKTSYLNLVKRKSEINQIIHKWSAIVGPAKQTSQLILHMKIDIRDKKIAEFNYKVLNSILACKSNLYKWKKTTNSNCDLCGTHQDIIHLLYSCGEINNIWQYIQGKLAIKLEMSNIIYGYNNDKDITYIISLISYTIYKQWIVASSSNTMRQIGTQQKLLLADLSYRQNLLKAVKQIKLANIIHYIIS